MDTAATILEIAEAQSMIVATPFKPRVLLVFPISVKDHARARNATILESRPALLTLNLFRKITIGNRHGNRNVFNPTKTTLNTCFQTSNHTVSLTLSPTPNETFRALRTMTPPMPQSHDILVRAINALDDNALMPFDVPTNIVAYKLRAKLRRHFTATNRNSQMVMVKNRQPPIGILQNLMVQGNPTVKISLLLRRKTQSSCPPNSSSTQTNQSSFFSPRSTAARCSAIAASALASASSMC
jgi:hypothetical protein